MKKGKKSKVAFLGMLLGVAFVLAYVESLIPFFAGIYGMKLGLANLAVMLALYNLGEKEAFYITVARIVLVAFTFGNLFSMLYSLAGGIFSFFIMVFAKKTTWFSISGVSVLGGVFHNIGQIIVAMCIVENEKILFYLPVLFISGVITGGMIGMLSGIITKRISKVTNYEQAKMDGSK